MICYYRVNESNLSSRAAILPYELAHGFCGESTGE